MLTALLFAIALPTAEDFDTISVTGIGSADRTAQRLAMTTTISANGKLAGDAITKQQSFRQQFDETMDSLGVAGLRIRSEGLSVSTSTVSPQQRQMMQVNGQEIPSSGITISETLVVDFAAPEADDDTLQVVRMLLDAGSDLDVTFVARGSSRLVQPIIEDVQALQNEAYENALKDARQKADHLASLTDREIGGVKSISVSSSSPNARSQNVGSMSPYQLMMAISSFEQTSVEDVSASDTAAGTQALTTHTENARLTVVFRLK